MFLAAWSCNRLLVSYSTGYYQTETFAHHKHDTTSQVAANETVDTGADAQTIMIIQDRDAYADSKDGYLVQAGQVIHNVVNYCGMYAL